MERISPGSMVQLAIERWVETLRRTRSPAVAMNYPTALRAMLHDVLDWSLREVKHEQVFEADSQYALTRAYARYMIARSAYSSFHAWLAERNISWPRQPRPIMSRKEGVSRRPPGPKRVVDPDLLDAVHRLMKSFSRKKMPLCHLTALRWEDLRQEEGDLLSLPRGDDVQLREEFPVLGTVADALRVLWRMNPDGNLRYPLIPTNRGSGVAWNAGTLSQALLRWRRRNRQKTMDLEFDQRARTSAD